MKAMKKKKKVGTGKGAGGLKQMAAGAKAAKAQARDVLSMVQKGNRKGKGKGGVTPGGKQICFKYARDGECTTDATQCPHKRAHVCEKCFQHHRNAECQA